MTKIKTLAKKPLGKERLYEVLIAPHITEKATLLSEQGKVVFKVSQDANKFEIKKAVEALFKVTVKSVNTLNVEGKVKRFKGRLGVRSGYKKAVVKLAEGQAIDMSAGL